MRRVYRFNVLTCSHCGGKRKVLAFLTNHSAIHDILAHLGLPTAAPPIAPARAPPLQALPFA